MSEEATVNPDGSTTFGEEYEAGDDTFDDAEADADGAETAEEIVKGTDPAIYLALAFVAAVALYYISYRRNKRKQMEREAFFYDMDGDKVRACVRSCPML